MRVLLGGLVLASVSAGEARASPPLVTRPLELPAQADADVWGRVDAVGRTLDSFSGTTTSLLLDLGLGARLRVPGVEAQVDLGLPVVTGRSHGDVGGVSVGVPAVGAIAWACAGRLGGAAVRIYGGLRTTFDPLAWSSIRDYADTELVRRVAVYDMAYRPGEVFSADSSIRFEVGVRWATPAWALQVGGIVGTSNRLGGDEDLDAPRSFFGGQVGGAVDVGEYALVGEGFVTCAGNPCYVSVHLGVRLTEFPAVTVHVSHFEGRDDDEPGNALGLRFEAGR